MKRHVWLLITLAVGALIIGDRHLPFAIRRKVPGWFVTEDTVAVTGAPVNRELMAHVVRGRGQLQAIEVVDVISPVAGQLSRVQLKVGDRVSKGQILATVRSYELLARVEKIAAALSAAKADLRQKENQLAEAEKTLERVRELRNKDLIAGRDLNEAETALDTARAQRALAQAQVAEQKAALEQTRYLLSVVRLVAPLNGVVTRVLAESGASVQTSMPVFTVGSLAFLKVMIEISEKDIDLVRVGVAVQIRADALPERVFAGQVTALRSPSETSQSVVAEVQLPNRDHLLAPGMEVEVTMVENSP
jgi:RND family efflux transporter MFP subunit